MTLTCGTSDRPYRQKKLAVLGSTGSIGMQTLDIVRRYPDRFAISLLSSNTRWEELARQAAEFMPQYVVIADPAYATPLRNALEGMPVKVLCGHDELAKITGGCDADTVVNALVGFSGLLPTVEALRGGKTLALANKESLVAAGKYVTELARKKRTDIVPVDSEHSAILQCLAGERSPVRRMILTASGGSLRDVPAEKLADVTVERALAHPNWTMGPKITVDSATMVNKGFEVIEARWLFGLERSRIEVVIHPESVVHSMVEFIDGAIKAQMGTPDMHLPIQYALTYPERWEVPEAAAFDFAGCGRLTFSPPDTDRFPSLATAYAVLDGPGDRGCVLNAANDAAVEAFLDGRIRFTDIHSTICHTLERLAPHEPATIEDIVDCNERACAVAREYISNLRG